MKKKAYGKINLSLHVYEKREDGYHNIESLITLIDIYDKMKFKKALETKVFVKKAKIKNNIVNKTIELIRKKYNLKAVSYTHLRAHETVLDLVCSLLLEKKKTTALPFTS